MDYIVEMNGITKRFPGIIANDNVTLKLKKGEIHAILGENGAGKSTLMSILFGLYKQDEGQIKIAGKEVKISDPNDANRYGIGMVHQHFKLVDNFTVTENIMLGVEPKRSFGRIDFNKARTRVLELSEKYGLKVDVDKKIQDISVGMQQRVEILKMLYRDSEIMIFDEPTAVLTPQEITELIKIMKQFASEGKSILLITHKLKEIMAACDRCTVLRRGKFIGTVDIKDTNERKLAEMMVGREVEFTTPKEEARPKEVVLKVEDLSLIDDRKIKLLKHLSFEVKAGEILGVCGIDGNGQNELVEAITGLLRPSSGRIEVNGVDVSHMSIRQRTETGLSHIPADRHKHGLVLEFRLDENIVLQTYYKESFTKKGLLNFKAIEQKAKELIDEFDIRSSNGPATIARSMSGGNQQKAIVGREIDRHAKLLIAVQPTRGLDVGAISYIHKRIVEARDGGAGVLLVSLELDEILNLSDRIIVMYEGAIVGNVLRKDSDENELGLMMSGSKKVGV